MDPEAAGPDPEQHDGGHDGGYDGSGPRDGVRAVSGDLPRGDKQWPALQPLGGVPGHKKRLIFDKI